MTIVSTMADVCDSVVKLVSMLNTGCSQQCDHEYPDICRLNAGLYGGGEIVRWSLQVIV